MDKVSVSSERLRREEESRLVREMHEVPHPSVVASAVARISAVQQLVFELELEAGTWRSVWLTQLKPMPVSGKDSLTVLFAKPVLLVPTPYMSQLDFYVAVSESSLKNKYCSVLGVVPGWRNGKVGFRAANDEAAAWLRLQLAKASGMRFRSHGMVDTSKLVYSK